MTSGGTVNDGGSGGTQIIASGGSTPDDPNCNQIYVNGCTCAWSANKCSSSIANPFLGAQCPPTLEEAWLVANWNIPKGKTGVTYEECSDGTRYFTFTGCGALSSFGFDQRGRLLAWYENSKICGGRTCDTPMPTSADCRSCPMTAAPGPAGSTCQTTKPNNGFSPSCMVDADGHWLAPPLCDD